MTSGKIPTQQAAALVDELFTFMPKVAEHINDRLDPLGLTSTEYWALRNLDGPVPMKDLAVCMDYDPSYVTVVADRLEAHGLVTRQQDKDDRRVKNLVLTAKGRQLKKSLPETLWNGSNVFSPLTDMERAQLHSLIAKLTQPASE